MSIAMEVVGWIGASLILAAYVLISAGRIGGRSNAYQIMNICGSAGVLLNSGYNGAIPSAALNLVWLGIGTVVLLRRRPEIHSTTTNIE